MKASLINWIHRTFIILSGCILMNTSSGQGGMWMPNKLEGLNEKEMQEMGMELEVSDIYHPDSGSLKDGIVRFGRGCTGAIISGEGLLITNHHCGYGNIQRLSTVENNLLKNGFWAATRADELPAPGLTVTIVDRIEDVTETILSGIGVDMDPRERQSIVDQRIDALRKATPKTAFQEIEISPFYQGNQYFLFVVTIYRDIRLVGCPPESIGKFGSDTDNWVWPRHTGDFALFRIYAGPDNLPAVYAPENKPLTPKHYFPVSIEGVKERDFTMVFGFPGRTKEYLPAVAIEQTVNVVNPARIELRTDALSIMNKYMRNDEKIRLQYASKSAGIANAWKKWIGENQGLKAVKAVEKKKAFESEFLKKVRSNPEWNDKYGSVLSDFERLYKELEPLAFAEAYSYETTIQNIELVRLIGFFNELVKAYKQNGQEGFLSYREKLAPFLNGFYKDYHPEIDKEIFAALFDKYMDNMEKKYIPFSFEPYESGTVLADVIYNNTMFTKPGEVEKLLQQDDIQFIVDAIESDLAFYTAVQWREIYDQTTPEFNRITEQINHLQMKYMKALMEVFPDFRFFPDANSTLRLTYGYVNGYKPKDAIYYLPNSYFTGVMEKYIPGDYEFDLPVELISLYNKKDYGVYADETGDVPVCFIGTNHTTGGNSGSPVLNRYGHIIGLNFDRVWEGTMSDIYYDPAICRNIMLDTRYILFIIEKFANAGHLISEMDVVLPK